MLKISLENFYMGGGGNFCHNILSRIAKSLLLGRAQCFGGNKGETHKSMFLSLYNIAKKFTRF